jgi:hypothetical protein
MGKRHWIGMAGLSGYLPNYCAVFDSKRDAARSLAEMHDGAPGVYRRLMRQDYAALDLKRDGNEYAEIMACACDTPEAHEDC